MKFGQLAMGKRFGYRGETFVKESPLQATRESDGHKKLIPRSAVITLLDTRGEPVVIELPANISRSAFQRASAEFRAELSGAIGKIEPPLNPDQQHQLLAAITIACDRLVDRLAVDVAISENV